MNAILTEYEQLGIRLSLVGDSLQVDAPKGVLTPGLVARIRASKPFVIRELLHGLSLADIKHAAGDDWAVIEADAALLDAFARSIVTRRMRDRGQIPPNYTATTKCRGCGFVPIWPGAPEYVQSCPWCFNRAKGLPVPKPPMNTDEEAERRASGMVKCAECKNLVAGRCTAINGGKYRPLDYEPIRKWRRCDSYEDNSKRTA